VPAQWRSVALDTLIVLAYLLTYLLSLTNKPYRPRLRFESRLTYGVLQMLFTYLLTTCIVRQKPQKNLQCKDPIVFSFGEFTAACAIPVVCLVDAFHRLAWCWLARWLLLGIAISARTSADTQTDDPTTQNFAVSRLQSKDGIYRPSTQVSDAAAVTHEPIDHQRPITIDYKQITARRSYINIHQQTSREYPKKPTSFLG